MESKNVDSADSRWSLLYKIAGVAAIISLATVPVQLIIFIASPPPDTAIGWFELFQKNKLIGLLAFELLIVVDNVIAVTIYLAFYAALKRVNRSFMAIATVLGLMGIMAFFSSRPAFDMLFLSNRYAAATTDVQRSMLLAAGEMCIAVFNGTASHLGYVLAAIAPIIISLVMLRSKIFGKVTAYIGIITNVVGLGIYIPKIGIIPGIISVFPLIMIWYVLVAKRFFELGDCKRLINHGEVNV